jgi:hypothetical protein
VVNLWIGYCYPCSGIVGRGPGVELICGLDIAGCEFLEWGEEECLLHFVDWILLAV